MGKPDVAWIGVRGLLELERFINSLVPPHRQDAVWRALRPLLDSPSNNDKRWLADARSALSAVAPDVADGLTNRLADVVSALRWCQLREAVGCGCAWRLYPLDDGQVLDQLRRLAWEATRNLPPTVRAQAADDAPGVIVRAFPRFDQSRPFNPWAHAVLSNHAVSLCRSQSRIRTDSEYLDAVASPLAPLAEDRLAGVLLDFRCLCDTADFPRRMKDGPELVAVFALEVRLRLLAELACLGREFLDVHLPLSVWERGLRIKDGWPTLGELWEDLADQAEPGLSNVEAVRAACRRLASGASVAGLHKVWNTWVKRAKDAVGRQLRSHAQGLLFDYLFRSNSSDDSQQSLQAS